MGPTLYSLTHSPGQTDVGAHLRAKMHQSAVLGEVPRPGLTGTDAEAVTVGRSLAHPAQKNNMVDSGIFIFISVLKIVLI